MKLRKLLSFALLLASPAYAADESQVSLPVVESVTQSSRFNFGVATEFTSLAVQSSLIYGAGVNASFGVGLTPRWAVGMGLGQAFTQRATAFYTRITIEGSFALIGTQMRRQQVTTIDGTKVSTFTEHAEWGTLRLHAHVNQFFLNTTIAALPFVGFGGSLSYELPSIAGWNFRFGVRCDRVTNDTLTIFPLSGFAGVALWL